MSLSNSRFQFDDIDLEWDELVERFSQFADQGGRMSYRREDGRIISQGTPEQILYQISEAIKESQGLDDSEVPEIVMGYILDMEDKVAEKYEGDMDGFLRDMAGGFLANEIAEEVARTGEVPAGVKSPFNTMIDQAKDFARFHQLEKYYEEKQQEAEAANDIEIEVVQDQDERLYEETTRPLPRAEYPEETIGEAAQKAQAERQKQFEKDRKWSQRISKAISKGIKKVRQKQHQTRVSRFWKSDQGQDLKSRFIENAARVSMATRRAMGANTRLVPAKSDYDNAKRQLVSLMGSGSISKENVLRHLSGTRELAGKDARRMSGVKADKAPGMLRVKNTLAKMDIRLDMDATLERTKLARSKLNAQTFALMPSKVKVDVKKFVALSLSTLQEQQPKVRLSEKGRKVGAALRRKKAKDKGQENDKDKDGGLDK